MKREGFLNAVTMRPVTADIAAQYPFALPAVQTIEALQLHPAVNFFVGENGSGKSTVLGAIAVAARFNAEGGSRNFRFSTRRVESPLGHALVLHRSQRRQRTGYFLRAESFYNVATEIEQLDEAAAASPYAHLLGQSPIRDGYGVRALHEQSHGEAFWALFMNRFGADGLYLLDEPEAALSPTRQLAFLVRMHDLVQQGSQFIIATHAPILLAYPDAQVWAFGDSGITRTSFADTEHYQITKRMLNDPTGMFAKLLDRDD